MAVKKIHTKYSTSHHIYQLTIYNSKQKENTGFLNKISNIRLKNTIQYKSGPKDYIMYMYINYF